jgi:abequosyltransferase
VLTIAIPTFERAAELDRQLAWLARAVEGHEDAVELVVSDNCSSDATAEVVARWQRTLGPDLLQARRQPENVGAIRNIRDCLVRARQPHVWVVGDDDHLQPTAVTAVLARLRAHPEVGLLTLNFSSRSAVTGQVRFERCYRVAEDQLRPDGAAAFAALLHQDYGGVALTTAQVYRSDLVRQAAQAWGDGRADNLVVQVYWGAYAAARGGHLLTADVLLECVADTHFFVADPVLHARLGLVDMPELASRLRTLGYPDHVLHDLVLQHLSRQQLRLVRRAFRQDPRGTADAVARYSGALRRTGGRALVLHTGHRVRTALGLPSIRSRGQRLPSHPPAARPGVGPPG